MPDYTPFEMIAYTGSRVLEDEKIVFVGTGLPIIASMHAQLTHAPGLSMIFESGPLSPILEMGMPLSVGDTRACRKACFLKGLSAVFELTQRGYSDYAFIGGAQIDMYGNVCSTFEGGTYNVPQTRFPGSGGAGAMAANCEKSIIIMALEKRRFTEKVEFLTSIGFGDGSAVEVLPGKKAKDIQDMVGFDLLISPDLKEMAEPTAEDLRLLREVCDPEGYFLNRKVK